MGWGQALGGFFEGYQKTMANRAADREKQFSNLMGLAQKYRDIADRERGKTVLDENSKTIITEAEMNAQKAVMDAERAMNNHIGGLSKLSGLFKRLMGGGGKTEGGQSAEGSQGASSATPEPPAAQEQAPAPAASESSPPPLFSAGFTPQQKQWIGLPPPPDATPAPAPAAPAPAAKPSLMNLRPGQYINPEIAARQQMNLDAKIAEAKATGQVQLEQQLESQKKLFEQTSTLREEEFNKMVPDLKKAGMSDKDIEKTRLAYRTGMTNILKTTANKPIIDRQRPYKGPDGKWYSNTYVFDEETGQYTLGTPVETGPPSAVTNISAKMQEKIANYQAQHPGTSDEDAETAVRSTENKLIENKLKSSNWKAVSDQQLAAYRGDRTKFYREAQEAKKAGKGMTPQLAQSVLVHADSMAKADLEGRFFDEPEDKSMALLNSSNNWLMSNVGMSREDLQQIITAKPKPSLADRTKAAKEGLLKPPTESGKTAQPGKKAGASTNPP